MEPYKGEKGKELVEMSIVAINDLVLHYIVAAMVLLIIDVDLLVKP